MIKNLCVAQTTLNKVKKTNDKMRKVCATHVRDKRLISITYKELQKEKWQTNSPKGKIRKGI